jgi:hypothetical protein
MPNKNKSHTLKIVAIFVLTAFFPPKMDFAKGKQEAMIQRNGYGMFIPIFFTFLNIF